MRLYFDSSFKCHFIHKIPHDFSLDGGGHNQNSFPLFYFFNYYFSPLRYISADLCDSPEHLFSQLNTKLRGQFYFKKLQNTKENLQIFV
jgi:hypothetical protein